MKNKILAFACLIIVALPLNAGWIFDDPVDLEAEHISHTFAKDEIKFTPSGKCEGFMILHAEVTLELKYSTFKRTLYISQAWWDKLKPLTIELPDNLAGLQSYRLTGKFYRIWRFKKNAKLDPNAQDKAKDIAKNIDVVTGYKLDSTWSTK